MLFFLIFAIITLGFYPLIAYLIQSIRRKESNSPIQVLDAEFLKEKKEGLRSPWRAHNIVAEEHELPKSFAASATLGGPFSSSPAAGDWRRPWGFTGFE